MKLFVVGLRRRWVKTRDMKDFGIMRASEAIEKAMVVKEENEIKRVAFLAAEKLECIRAFEKNDWVRDYVNKVISEAVSNGYFSVQVYLQKWDEAFRGGSYVSWSAPDGAMLKFKQNRYE